MIDKLFRPWFGGVFLDRSLEASSEAFEYSFSMFSAGRTALPAEGMGAIPRQIADSLPEGTIRLGACVESIDGQRVRLASGEELETPNLVLATEAPQTSRLLGEQPPAPGRGVRTLHFAADKPPVHEPILVLNGEGSGPVNDLCVPSEVAASYAANGRALVTTTVLDDVTESGESLVTAVRRQMRDWFGEQADDWQHLRTFRVQHALPAQSPGRLRGDGPCVRPGLYVCGDHREAASLQGAMLSGRRAAEAILEV
jgi:phytoene dehydrogenase-like protein